MIEFLLFLFSLLNTAYVLGLAIAGHFYKKKTILPTPHYNRIAILVPCYKEDHVIRVTAEKFLNLDYPTEQYDVIIIADAFQQETLNILSKTRAVVLPVAFSNSMKCKAINYAFNHIEGKYDIAIIADADNVFAKSFLTDINSLFQQNYKIIQAQRVAKNSDTPMAVLDGLSEAINNHLFRQAPNALGLSSALIGSGMAFPYELLKKEFSKIHTPVEDKALQIALVEQGHSILYQKGTLVFDEKVASPEAYKNQRRRWIGGQYSMLRKNFLKSFRLLLKGNINFFNIAFIQNFLPSRINSIIYLFLLSIVFTIIQHNHTVMLRWWSLTSAYLIALALAVPKRMYSFDTLKALLLMPLVVLKTIQAIFLSYNATKTFIHTQHTTTEANSHKNQD